MNLTELLIESNASIYMQDEFEEVLKTRFIRDYGGVDNILANRDLVQRLDESKPTGVVSGTLLGFRIKDGPISYRNGWILVNKDGEIKEIKTVWMN